MSLVPVVIDYEVSYPCFAGEGVSLLTLPLGAGSIMDHLLSGVDGIGREGVLVIPSYGAGGDYEDRLRAGASSAVRVLPPDEFALFLRDCETSDYLLVVEPRRWPVAGLELPGTVARLREYRGATHVVGVGADTEGTRELVECDAEGEVKRVQRFYNLVSWPEVASTAITCSLVPARAVADIRFTSLMELRSALSVRGALSRDVPTSSDVVDLADEGAFLAVHERVLARTFDGDCPPGFSSPSPEVLVGGGCRVHPSARLVPPIIIQPGVTIEDGVTVIGPTLVGPGSRIGRGAIVAQAVLVADTVVPSGAMVRHRVVSGRGAESELAKQDTPGELASALPEAMNSGTGAEPSGVTPVPREVARRGMHFTAKRVMDMVLSALALLLLSPLLIVVAILIKLDSRGPVFFKHYRERKGGKEFPCLKFRTMVVDAHYQQRALYADNEVDGPQFKIRDDPRVTRVGRWLRATNVDELPQLINVLLGHMSLVGPRPSPFRENQICVSWRRARLSVRPGITGLWQLCRAGERGGAFHQWIYYDIMYVRHFSVWLDMRIFLATVLSLGGQRNVPLSWLIPTAGRDPVYLEESVAS